MSEVKPDGIKDPTVSTPVKQVKTVSPAKLSRPGGVIFNGKGCGALFRYSYLVKKQRLFVLS